jgi:hypothetical protein
MFKFIHVYANIDSGEKTLEYQHDTPGSKNSKGQVLMQLPAVPKNNPTTTLVVVPRLFYLCLYFVCINFLVFCTFLVVGIVVSSLFTLRFGVFTIFFGPFFGGSLVVVIGLGALGGDFVGFSAADGGGDVLFPFVVGTGGGFVAGAVGAGFVAGGGFFVDVVGGFFVGTVGGFVFVGTVGGGFVFVGTVGGFVVGAVGGFVVGAIGGFVIGAVGGGFVVGAVGGFVVGTVGGGFVIVVCWSVFLPFVVLGAVGGDFVGTFTDLVLFRLLCFRCLYLYPRNFYWNWGPWYRSDDRYHSIIFVIIFILYL